MSVMAFKLRRDSKITDVKSNKIIQMPDLSYVPDPKGLGHAYYKSMLKNGDALAQIDGLTGEKDTFGQLLQRSIRVALHMKDRGIVPGDIVCTCTFNHLNSGVPLIAAMFVGAISTSVDPTLSLNDTVFLLQQVQPKLIFVEADSREKMKSVLSIIDCKVDTIVFGNTSCANQTPFSQLLQRHQRESTFTPWTVKSLEDIAIVAFSSGTTGYPKGICHNHYTILCQAMNKTDGLVTPSGLILCYASPFWSVFNSIFTLSVIRGVARLVYPRYDPTRAWEMFDYKLTYLFINTVQMAIMCRQGRPKHVNSDALTDVQIGGDIAQTQQVLQMKKMFPKSRVHLIYGQSEVPTAITFFDGTNQRDVELLNQKPMSVGKGLYGMCYKIVDVETEEILGPNQHGELRVKTKIQTSGYYKMSSSDIWDSDGWLKTGDLGYYDEDECFFVIGRVKEMFKYQEWHVIPTVLEDVLCGHPGVAWAAVAGVPHEIDGHHPMAFVVLKPTHLNVPGEEIEKYLEGKVHDRQRLRGGVRIVNSIPLTTSGKVNRALLKSLI